MSTRRQPPPLHGVVTPRANTFHHLVPGSAFMMSAEAAVLEELRCPHCGLLAGYHAAGCEARRARREEYR